MVPRMDFGDSEWDIDTAAESLNASLFSELQSAQRKKGKKRKYASVDIGAETTGRSSNNCKKKIKRKKDSEKLVTLQNSGSEVSKEKVGHTNLTKVQKKKRKRKLSGDGKKITPGSVSEPTVTVGNLAKKGQSGTSFVPDGGSSKSCDTPGNNEESPAKKKKKRKRICKRNKFKEYSQTEKQILQNHDLVNGAALNTELNSTDVNPIAMQKKKNINSSESHSKTNSQITNVSISVDSEKREKRKKKRKKKATDNDTPSSTVAKTQETSEGDLVAISPRKKKRKKKKKYVDLTSAEVDDSGHASVQSDKFHKKSKVNKQEVHSTLSSPSQNSALNRKTVAALLAQQPTEHEHTPKKKEEPKSLLEKNRERLNAARFRYINEQLYTRTGEEAVSLFNDDTEAFKVYHDGFQSQVEKWPTNPVQLIIKHILSKPKHLVVADFGCGDAKLARSVPNKVHSFDLVALNDSVTVCDMSQVPLGSSSVDIAVFCLSLMGTNLSSYLQEANRVLKQGGLLKIAEVSSRFQSTAGFIRQVEKLGFKLDGQETGNKMFVMLDFRKKKSSQESMAVDIKLSPCVYKKR